MQLLNDNFKRSRDNFLYNDHFRFQDQESQRLKMSVKIRQEFEPQTAEAAQLAQLQESNALVKRQTESNIQGNIQG
jgi:hypothetical protein